MFSNVILMTQNVVVLNAIIQSLARILSVINKHIVYQINYLFIKTLQQAKKTSDVLPDFQQSVKVNINGLLLKRYNTCYTSKDFWRCDVAANTLPAENRQTSGTHKKTERIFNYGK